MAGMCGFLWVSAPSALLGAWHLVYCCEALPGIFQGLLFVWFLLAKVQQKYLKTFHISFDLTMTQIKALFSSNQIKALFSSSQINVLFSSNQIKVLFSSNHLALSSVIQCKKEVQNNIGNLCLPPYLWLRWVRASYALYSLDLVEQSDMAFLMVEFDSLLILLVILTSSLHSPHPSYIVKL